ncbi:hypothetical protein SLEP1_g46132 [Rubroshorea leprosula]|uniref:Reverse transcriptase Ty1/copia-type domain-containing protein n=1 Tax=Rubroshorea leprosula TaxID=152421 RepID=A0AAV5LNM6_9ROSI|nr:hypothetical protein SLEP1_g46132 [Rubroshorea leprosula]
MTSNVTEAPLGMENPIVMRLGHIKVSMLVMAFATFVLLSQDLPGVEAAGKMFRDELLSLWGGFVLIVFGQVDSFSAYSPEDNEQWKRYSGIISLQSFSVAGMIGLYTETTKYRSLALPIVVFMTIEADEKIAALKMAARSSLAENTKLISAFTASEHRISIVGEPDPIQMNGLQLFRHWRSFRDVQGGATTIPDSTERRQRRRDYERALRVVEVELCFLFDLFYTKCAVIFKEGQGLRKRKILNTLFLVGFGVFLTVKFLIQYKPSPHELNLITTGGVNLDKRVTVILIVGILFMAIAQSLFLIMSDWAMVLLICNYVRGIYDDGAPRQGRTGCSKIELLEEVKKAVILNLRTVNGRKLSNGKKSLRQNNLRDELFWACRLETPTHVILVWHIATSLCKIATRPKSLRNGDFVVDTRLSDYCAYLVAFGPRLTSDSAIDSEFIFNEVLKDARGILKGCQSDRDNLFPTDSMASKNYIQPSIPHLDGHHYDHWSMLMENFLRSKEYWIVVEVGVPKPTASADNAQMVKIKKEKLKDLKAKNYLFQATDRAILETILNKGESSNFVEHNEKNDDSSLFMVCHPKEVSKKNVWYLDIDCSNHTCGDKSVFSDLDEFFQDKVKFGDNSTIVVKRRGKLQKKGYEILIKDGVCQVFHSTLGLIAKVKMTGNRHLYFGGLKALYQKKMVNGLPHFDSPSKICEICMTKSEALVAFKNFKVLVENEAGRSVKVLHTDHGDLPEWHKTNGVKWIYKTKLKENGKVDKFKARLVAKGYKQEFGTDYQEVFAPVVRMDTIRLVIALAAQNSWSIYQHKTIACNPLPQSSLSGKGLQVRVWH